MDNAQERIFNTLDFIDSNITKLVEERKYLQAKILKLEEENQKLKSTNKSVITELESYIEEMERIRKDYVSRNNNN